MSGKTTFGTLMLNALFVETDAFGWFHGPVHAAAGGSIRISDDISSPGTVTYLQEVLTVKRLLEGRRIPAPACSPSTNLFKRDGNTQPKRIAAGKAVLAHLNRGPHIVLGHRRWTSSWRSCCESDGYETAPLPRILDGRLVFDYRLHTGPLTTRTQSASWNCTTIRPN